MKEGEQRSALAKPYFGAHQTFYLEGRNLSEQVIFLCDHFVCVAYGQMLLCSRTHMDLLISEVDAKLVRSILKWIPGVGENQRLLASALNLLNTRVENHYKYGSIHFLQASGGC